MMMKSLCLLAALCLLTGAAHAFAPPRMVAGSSILHIHLTTGRLYGSSSSNDEEQRERLAKLGFTKEELDRRSASPLKEQPKVAAINALDIDPLTLTALGFGLIACNFFIFANMGTGGLAGVVATVMNTWDN